MIYTNRKVINNLCHANPVKGAVALEMEVEGNQLPHDVQGWRCTGDGSLRHNGVEYVSRGPVSLTQLKQNLIGFDDVCYANGSEILDSTRTSVHLHMNMQEETILDVIKGAVAYYMMEDSLMNYCGQGRKTNAFCLPLSQARNQIIGLKYYSGMGTMFNASHFKYTALNLGALGKFGSVEQRGMRGVYDKDILIPWVDNMQNIWKVAKGFDTPKDVLDHFYGRSYKDFCGTFLKTRFIDTISSYHNWDELQGINNSQLGNFLYNHEFPTLVIDSSKFVPLVQQEGTEGLLSYLPELRDIIKDLLEMKAVSPKYIREYVNRRYAFLNKDSLDIVSIKSEDIMKRDYVINNIYRMLQRAETKFKKTGDMIKTKELKNDS